MQHLNAPTNQVEQPYKVPYLCSDAEYDGQCFWDFPQRQGWGLWLVDAVLYKGIFHRIFNTPRTNVRIEVASLIQAWWYFGMLHEVLGTSVNLQDFVTSPAEDGTRYITTEALESSAEAFYRRLKQLPLQEAAAVLEKGILCVNHVHVSVEFLAKRIEDSMKKLPKVNGERPRIRGMQVSQGGQISITGTTILDIIAHTKKNPYRSVAHNGRKFEISVEELELFALAQLRIYGREILSHELEVSVCVLGYALSHALRNISLKLGLTSATLQEYRGWYIPASIHRRIMSNQLCPRVFHRLRPTLLLGGSYFLSQLAFGPEPPVGTHHADCTKDLCVADRLKDGVNPKNHAVPNCGCESVAEDVVLMQIMAIIEEGETPLLRLVTSSEAQLEIEVFPARDMYYAAISHVWSDGLGNSEANEVFSCQWRRLQALVDGVFPLDFKETSTPFWLDTICIPICKNKSHTRDQCRRRRLRENSIRRMRKIYRDADHVLILDATMISLPSCLSIQEFGLRLACSKWMRRLWTLHEGAMARRAFVRIRDGWVSLDQLSGQIYTITFSDQSENSDKVLSSLGQNEAAVPWRLCLRTWTSSGSGGQYLLESVWNEARNRETKYLEDRYVVIASLLDLDNIETTYHFTEAEQMIEDLLTKLTKFPIMLLFTTGPRLQKRGLRWAPATLDVRIHPLRTEVPPAVRTPEGLVVDCKGLYLNIQPEWDRRFHWDGQWTRVLERGANLEGCCAWAVEFPEDDGDNCLYTVNIVAENHEDPRIAIDEKLAIILQPMPSDSSPYIRAVLVSCQYKGNDIQYANYRAPLAWKRHSKADDQEKARKVVESGSYQLIPATWDGREEGTRKWCIG